MESDAMMLSDRTIREYIKDGRIRVDPFDLEKQMGAVGIDLRLSGTFMLFRTGHRGFIDLTQEHSDSDMEIMEVPSEGRFMLHPGEFVLGMTMENVELPTNVVGRLDGRSSLGRLGIIVHSTAGRVDPGWKGRLTLEISNIGKLPIALIPGMKFCYLTFEELTSHVEKAYSGKYIGSSMPVASKINEEMKNNGKA
jgi:dCTP deaminase